MTQAKQSGFSLIELMIVVVIIGVLAMIAYPSYRDYIIRSHRADGQAALTECASIQERWFTKQNQYNSAAGTCGATSPDGYYTIAVAIGDQQNDGTCNTGGTPADNDCFDLTATPTSKGKQTDDTTCATMTLNSANTKGAQDGASADTTSTCWRS
ncbi:MAG: type IV pilin protein [Gammaproteobacteria bacterium]|nr:MAG: type IV pilin protein [Gammaproteobacteria bacterium]